MYHKLFINKFQPRRFSDFQLEDSFLQILNMLINTNTLNLLLIGDSGSGKTTLLDAIIREYYKQSKRTRHPLLSHRRENILPNLFRREGQEKNSHIGRH
jgi:GTPase SAR1 family protein